jgi:hypothetical protein
LVATLRDGLKLLDVDRSFDTFALGARNRWRGKPARAPACSSLSA